jgi:hypothetical protein
MNRVSMNSLASAFFAAGHSFSQIIQDRPEAAGAAWAVVSRAANAR